MFTIKKKNKMSLIRISSLICVFSSVVVLGGCSLVKKEQEPHNNISTIISTSSDADATITDAATEHQD